MAVKAVFLDKDGTLLENVPYNVDPERMRLVRGAGPALRRLHALGYSVIVVSNQPGVALGRFDLRALRAVERRLREMLAAEDVPLAGFYYCPHHPDGRVRRYAVICRCRKPAPGLLLSAATIHDIASHRSWMIGDILDDIEAGARARCRTILVDVGNETEWRYGPYRRPNAIVSDLPAAAAYVASSERGSVFGVRGSVHA
ncbi:MAG: D-glycero-alpha-D-manno-heptose-1,7-bisphosphate 7-phosphatase [Sulfurifustaceae bacterium]